MRIVFDENTDKGKHFARVLFGAEETIPWSFEPLQKAQ